MELNYKDGRLVNLGNDLKLLYFDGLKDIPYEISIKGQRSTILFCYLREITGYDQRVYKIYRNILYPDLEIRCSI